MRFYLARNRSSVFTIWRKEPARDVNGNCIGVAGTILTLEQVGQMFDRVPDHGETIVVETRDVTLLVKGSK